jgi:two-component system sensor histidine kinase UhpB
MTGALTVLLIISLAASGWLAATVARLRRKLRESNQVFQTLVSNAPVGVVQTDAEGRHTYSNEAWSRISGLSAEETSTGWQSVVHPDDLPDVVARWEQAIRSGQPYLNELRLRRLDGSERTVVAAVHPMIAGRETPPQFSAKGCLQEPWSGGSSRWTRFGPHLWARSIWGFFCRKAGETGAVQGFIGMVLDITELRNVGRKVRDTDALLTDLIDHSSAAIYVKDAEGRYLLANKRHTELWPAMRDFRTGTTPYDWFPEDVARSFVESDRAVWESGETITFEESIPQSDGPRSYVSVKFPIRNESGTIIAVGGISTDISELRKARRQLADREQLLRSLIQLQENERQLICHEFHDGLIQYVVGSIMLLERLQADSLLPESCRGTLDSVITCLGKGLEDARRVIRGIRPASLDDLGLSAAIDDLAGEVQADGIVVEMTIDTDLDQVADELHTTIYRVIQELFHNAVKHSGTTRLTLTVVVNPNTVDIVVQDYGKGFIATLPTDGFGLTGIRERVRLAGGSYDLQTAPGEGTRFAIRLPLTKSEDSAQRATMDT